MYRGVKERKTETEVEGQWKCGPEGEGTVGREGSKLCDVEATSQKHRPPMRHVVGGTDAVDEDTMMIIISVNSHQK